MPSDLRSQIKAVVPRLREAQAETRARERERRVAAERSAAAHLKEQQEFAAATRGVKPLDAPQRAPRKKRHARPQNNRHLDHGLPSRRFALPF